MTRIEKIEKIIEGTNNAIKELQEKGELTPEAFVVINNSMNQTILSIKQ